ncbi:ABC transporter ATP-binding protein [Nocardioides ginsengisoli]|uniref:ABC transporter ATP-binding protein n=1 Tax=Nocardioides ginsengisoli TaxID=363868 RepID=A0ABW3VU62_9ACTN
MAESLVAAGLSFGYGRLRPHQVFDGLDWAVRPGAVTLLLGPNGAGKSTLLKLLCGYLRPQAGTVALGGRSRRRDLVRSVAWMPQEVQACWGLTTLEQLEYAGWLAGLSRADARVRAADLIDRVDLGDKRGVRSARLSGGQLRRLGLAQALVRVASVLLLDEPTAGLDPAQTENVRSILAGLELDGGIVVSTHQVADLDGQVDRVAVLAEGRLRFDGTPAELGATAGDRQATMAQAFAAMIGGGRH